MIDISSGLRIAWKIAALEAIEKKSAYIEIDHFVLGLLSFTKLTDTDTDELDRMFFFEEKNSFYQILEGVNLNITQLRRTIREYLPLGSSIYSNNVIHRSEQCKSLFYPDVKYAISVLTSHYYFALAINDSSTLVHKIISGQRIDVNNLFSRLLDPVNAISSINDTEGKRSSGKYKNLEKYGKDMTAMAENLNYTAFEGRKNEIRQIITTLGKKTKHNPIIIGEPGVGKTAVVEGLAQLIVKKEILPGKRIFQVSAASLVAGTKYRGEFEERLKNIIDEVSESEEIILFFDEIHQFVGAGAVEGGLDAANILKPALSRGSFCCIGATTIGEYRKYIEKDPAFTRRFDCIYINEPSTTETLNILKSLKPELEEHHKVFIQEDALVACIELSIRYESDRNLPDKAIDLLDESCSAVKNKTITIADLNDVIYESGEKPVIDKTYIAKIISRRKGIPVSEITQQEAEKYVRLEELLKIKVKGQDHIIDEVSNHIKITKAGIGDANKPVGVFLFIGSTGVGKTYLAKTLAKILFSSEANMIRFDMSEYMEPHSVSKLIGAPPGYVGSDDEGLLIKNLRTKPYSVVLFDEIDKAHPHILPVLLQLFDEGRITDNKGRLIDGRNAIFIMTSNFSRKSRKFIGFNANDEEVVNNQIEVDIRKMYNPEFINRINKILVFNALKENDVKLIIENSILDLCESLHERSNIIVIPNPELNNFILSKCNFELMGAREVNRVIEKNLKEAISKLIIEYQAKGKRLSGTTIQIEIVNNKPEIIIS